jgi:ATP-dependent Clp protease ATP-binding subunit ClpA
VFDRFTDRARRVVVLAQEEAKMLGHNYIGTEHLLLGLVHGGEGVACQALESLGVSLSAARAEVEEIIGQGQAAPTVHMPFTPRAKKVLELSLREALQLGHNYIGTEHILLGLVREGEGVAAQVLQKLGADLNRVRQQVIMLLQGRTPEEGTGTVELADPREQARKAVERARRARDVAERLAAVSGDPSVTSAELLFGLLMSEERLLALEWLTRGLEEQPQTESRTGGDEPGEGASEET